MTMTIHKGDLVSVYNPESDGKLSLEGKATVIRIVREIDSKHVICEVRFGNNYSTTHRVVNPLDKIK